MRNLESRTAGCLTKNIKDSVKRAGRTHEGSGRTWCTSDRLSSLFLPASLLGTGL